MKKLLFLILVAIAMPDQIFGNLSHSSEIDSLLRRLERTERDTNRVHLLISLSHKLLYSDTAQVKRYLDEAFEISHNLNFVLGISSYYTSLGNLKYRISSYEKALKYYYLSLNIAEQHQFIHQIMAATNGIGSVYYAQKDYKKAKDLFIRQLKTYYSEINSALKFDYNNNIASCYAMLNVADSALYHYNEALKIAIDENMERNIVFSEINIAMIYKLDQKYELALDRLMKSLERAQALGRYELIALAYLNIAKTYHQMGEYDKAIIHANTSLRISSSINFPDLRLLALELLAEIYLKLNDADLVYSSLSQYIELKDSLLNETKNQQIAELHTRYEFAKKSEALKQLEERALHRKRTLTFVALLSIAIILLLALALVALKLKLNSKAKEELIRAQETKILEHDLEKKHQKETELIKDLERQRDEVKNHLLQVIRFTKEKEKLLDEFSELKQFLNPDGISVFKSIESNLRVDKIEMKLAEFEQQFNQANKDFFVRLLESHPNLTSNERQLSAFIALGLTGKEISKITQQSLNSIYVSRNRLKKKLSSGSQSLESYLKAILLEN